MKKILFLSLFCLAFAACHKKAVPEISSRTEFPPPPKSTVQSFPENSPESIAAGKIIFETRCNRCHELKTPEVYTRERWTSILETMIPRTRLNEEQARQVRSYVAANAKK